MTMDTEKEMAVKNQKKNVSAETKLNEQPDDAHNIFDTAFRTIIGYMPELIIPVINEIFKTTYPMEKPVVRKNEHFTCRGRIVTDLLIEVSDKLYHVEVQAVTDKQMVIRIFEYATSIAIEEAVRTEKDEDGYLDVIYPESCVIYLRPTRNTPDREKIRLIVPGGGQITFEVPALKMKDYTKDDLFRKNLLMLLPYYLIRYENELHKIGKLAEKEEADRRMDVFLKEYKNICGRLLSVCEEKEDGYLYLLVAEQIKRIAEYLAPDNEKERVIDMGGTVMKPQAQIILEQGEEKAKKEIAKKMYKRGDSPADIADIVGYSVEKIEQWLGIVTV